MPVGIPAAFPKPFNVVPPDKNKSPSVKIAAVGGGKDHSSVTAVIDGFCPPKFKAPPGVEAYPLPAGLL